MYNTCNIIHNLMYNASNLTLWLCREIFVCIRPVSYVPNVTSVSLFSRGLSWSSSYGSWINNYLCNQYLSPLNLWV